MAQNTDFSSFLEDARLAIAELDELKSQEQELTKEISTAEQKIFSEQAALRKLLDDTISKRRNELVSSYDSEMSGIARRLKGAQARREKAKNQGMKDRIAEETADLRDQNQEIADKLSERFKADRVPAICRTKLYYSLYFPRAFSEFLILILAFLLCFAVIPLGVYWLLPGHRALYLALIYVADIVIFGGLYILVGNATKNHHLEALKDGIRYRRMIRMNRKKMRVIAASIRREGDDAVYNLEMYDDDIARLEQEQADLEAKKKEALGKFETVTKNIITDEISAGNKERIEELRDAAAEMHIRLDGVESAIREHTIEIANRYESYIGKDFLTEERLIGLEEILENGEASNIMEAKEVYLDRKPGLPKG